MPLFSIITVSYNSEKTIEKTIKSVLSQNNNNFEYIIIDGKSSDSTIDIVNRYKNNLRVISEKDNGIYDAMNKGIQVARGRYIGFLNSDDYYENEILNDLELVLKEEDEFIYGDTRLIYTFDDRCIKKVSYANSNINKKSLNRGMGFVHQSCFVRKDIFDKIGSFNEEYNIGADWDFTIRCYNEGIRLRYINKVISNFSKDGVSARSHIIQRNKIRVSNNLSNKINISLIQDIFNPAMLVQNIFGEKVFLRTRELYHNFIKRK